MKTKLCRPVLIESKEDSNIGLYNNKLYYSEFGNKTDNWKNKHLILISLDTDEKIEDGDLFYADEIHGKIETAKYDDKKVLINGFIAKYCKKVIATQSQLLPEYINQFIEEYNKGEVKDVEIEMECYDVCIKCGAIHDSFLKYSYCHYPTACNGELESVTKPKLTNGFVTIVKKESIIYTEEEVEKLIYKCWNKAFQYGINETTCSSNKNLANCNSWRDWFNNNKKK